jgi:competence ComEA-like helix-hairpin-helix protein
MNAQAGIGLTFGWALHMQAGRTTGPHYDLGWRRQNVLALIVLCLLAALGLASRRWAQANHVGDDPPVDAAKVAVAEEKINPNTASAASLNRLPEVGPAKTRAIIEYRSPAASRPAFRYAEDLDDVHGVGPGIVERAAPYLSLPQRAQSRPGGD